MSRVFDSCIAPPAPPSSIDDACSKHCRDGISNVPHRNYLKASHARPLETGRDAISIARLVKARKDASETELSSRCGALS